MKVKDILDRVTTLYNDAEYIRVPESSYLKFLDDALNMLLLLRPDCHIKSDVVKLNKGTRQNLPSEGRALIDLYLNKLPIFDSDGVTIKEYINHYPIVQVRRDDLDYFSNWQYQSGAVSKDYISEFAYESKNPRMFWVNPPVNEKDVYVEMDYSYEFPVYSAMKDALNTELDLQDHWMGPLCAYMLYLLYSIDSTSTVDRQIAASYLQSFYQSVSAESTSTTAVKPTLSVVNSDVTERSV